ncbi:hypothetical protein B0T21DRAFT_33275 [Apiosordaria backusii]|uniref:Uncharacterized protein n=1 Tax=Apiosordaria backusii TaxID=314023 RepID=A0AA40E623_9PEZI|nr:hypothetical protein B0T21DRAFT_33275 [Apiosordaria backusii]
MFQDPSLRSWRAGDSPVVLTQPSPLSQAGSWRDYERDFKPEIRAQPGKMAPRRMASLRRIAPPDYKPAPLRRTFLVVLVVVMLVCIVLLECACQFLPTEVDRRIIPESDKSPTSNVNSTPTDNDSPPLLKPRLQLSRRLLQNATLDEDRGNSPDNSPDNSPVNPPAVVVPITTPSSSPASVETLPTLTPAPPATKATTEDSQSSITQSSAFADPGSVTVTPTAPPEPSTAPTSNFADIGTKTLSSTTTDPGNPMIGDGSNFGQDGLQTITEVPDTNPAGFIGIVVLPSTTLEELVTTVTKQTTITGVATTTVTGATTLSGIVVSFTETQTIDQVVTQVPSPTTIYNVVTAVSPSYVTASVMTLTDEDGNPTATVINTPPPVFSPDVITVTDSRGAGTLTITTNVLVPPRTKVITNSQGVATATITEFPTFPTDTPEQQPQAEVSVYYISRGQYFVGFFLPTILAVMLTIPIRMIDMAAKQYQPWHALTQRMGVPAEESLCLRTNGFHGIVSSLKAMASGQMLMVLTTLLTISSVFLVPLSAEAVALKLHGNCSPSDFNGCAMTLGVFLGPARATTALLSFMVVLLVLILFVLRKWRTGVAANPWTIAGMGTLATNRETRAAFCSLPPDKGQGLSHSKLVAGFGDRTFRLGHFFNHYGIPEYGVMASRANVTIVRPERPDSVSTGVTSPQEELLHGQNSNAKSERHLPFLMLSYSGRIAFLLPLTGIMVVVLYYNNTGGDTNFERFMSTQNFGVRSLFTLLGVGITLFWSAFFTSLAILSPYQLMSQSPRPAQQSITLSTPMNAFSGIWSAVKRRHIFLIVVAATAILAEFLPILLNNVPFRVTQTWVASRVCTWLAVAIMSIMWLVVAASFFIKWPHMPVDPSTIAGAMYYVCDSWMLWSLEGLSQVSKEECDRRVNDVGMQYAFGNIVGQSGNKKVGVDGVKEYA